MRNLSSYLLGVLLVAILYKVNPIYANFHPVVMTIMAALIVYGWIREDA